MHELITGLASLIILGLFVSQFVAGTNLYFEACAIGRTVNEYVNCEYEENEIEQKLEELKNKINEIPNTRAEIKGDGLSIRIDDVIGPASACGIEDNSITIEKNIKLRTKEETHEESDNNGGAPDSDGTSGPVPDGTEHDGAFKPLEGSPKGDDGMGVPGDEIDEKG